MLFDGLESVQIRGSLSVVVFLFKTFILNKEFGYRGLDKGVETKKITKNGRGEGLKKAFKQKWSERTQNTTCYGCKRASLTSS